MSKYRQPFLTELKRHWVQRFAAWQHGICAPVFWASKDGTFTNTSSFKDKGLVFHAVINFTPKSAGTFTCDIVVTSGLEPFVDNPPLRWPNDVPALPIDSYRIGWFVAGQDIWWRLVDDAAGTQKLYAELGVDTVGLHIARQPNNWYASSYAVGKPHIITEAAGHFSDTFERYVVPKLCRE